MKKHLLTLLLLPLLTACPEQQTGQTEIPAPSGTPVPVANAFPHSHLSCCWDQLAQKEADYQTQALAAFNGDEAALKKLLALSGQLEIGLSYAHGTVLAEILNHLGDARFAYVLQQEKLDATNTLFEEKQLDTLRNLIEGGFTLNTDAGVRQRQLSDFPLTAGLLIYKLESKVAAPATP